jgi:hypothetical protein
MTMEFVSFLSNSNVSLVVYSFLCFFCCTHSYSNPIFPHVSHLSSTSVVCVMLSIASMSFHSILLCRFFLALSHLFFMLNLSSNAMGVRGSKISAVASFLFFVFVIFIFFWGVLSSHEKSCNTILNGKG